MFIWDVTIDKSYNLQYTMYGDIVYCMLHYTTLSYVQYSQFRLTRDCHVVHAVVTAFASEQSEYEAGDTAKDAESDCQTHVQCDFRFHFGSCR